MSDKKALREIRKVLEVDPKNYKLEKIGGEERIVSLDYSGCHLSYIPEDIFVSLPHLRTLNLSLNDLQEIELKTFAPLVNLHTLNLSKNTLSSLSAEHFIHNSSLHVLDLSENKFKYFEEDLFTHLQQLRFLDIHRNTIGDSLCETPKLFWSLNRLQRLNMRNNFIHELPRNLFTEDSALEELNVSNNYLLKFVLDNLYSLKILKLNNNQLISLDTSTFILMDRLEVLHLQNNELQAIPVEILQGKPLKEVNLEENPLNERLRRRWEYYELSELFETIEIFG